MLEDLEDADQGSEQSYLRTAPRMFEPGQLTREADALTHARLEAARAELDAERDYDVNRTLPRVRQQITVQIFPHGYEAHCTPCERRARHDAA